MHICLCGDLSLFEKVIEVFLFRINLRERHSGQSFFKFSVLFCRRLRSRVWGSTSIHTKLGTANFVTAGVSEYLDKLLIGISNHPSESANLIWNQSVHGIYNNCANTSFCPWFFGVSRFISHLRKKRPHKTLSFTRTSTRWHKQVFTSGCCFKRRYLVSKWRCENTDTCFCQL